MPYSLLSLLRLSSSGSSSILSKYALIEWALGANIYNTPLSYRILTLSTILSISLTSLLSVSNNGLWILLELTYGIRLPTSNSWKINGRGPVCFDMPSAVRISSSFRGDEFFFLGRIRFSRGTIGFSDDCIISYWTLPDMELLFVLSDFSCFLISLRFEDPSSWTSERLPLERLISSSSEPLGCSL